VERTVDLDGVGWVVNRGPPLFSSGEFFVPMVQPTAARWPNFQPNNSKEGPPKCLWPEKIKGCKIAEFTQKGQKRGRKIFVHLFRGETLFIFFYFPWELAKKHAVTLNFLLLSLYKRCLKSCFTQYFL
jgi:hypothetical protein